jgi:pilus assembly protein CpaB
MNRQTRTFVVLVVAVVVAAAASYAVYRAVASIPVRQVEIATAKAVVAARPMPIGTLVTRESVKEIDWPARTPLSGGYARIEDVVDRGLVAPVVENELLTVNNLAAKEAGAGLPPMITEGMRAISIKVDEVINVAGFVTPGTRVDVLVVINPTDNSTDRIARVVVSNVPVLTSGTRYDQDEARKGGKPVKSTVVTVMVTPEDAERIALAQADGRLMLTLRNPLDVEPTVTAGIRKAGLFSSGPPVAAPASRPSGVRRLPPPVILPLPSVPTVYTVETIKAAKKTEQQLEKSGEK